MKKNDIKLTEEQLQTLTTLFKALETLAKDKTFNKKLNAAYKMDDADITEENEDDYMKLLNFKDDVIDYTNCSFN